MLARIGAAASREVGKATCRRITRVSMLRPVQVRSFSMSDAEKPWYMLGAQMTELMGDLPKDIKEDYEIAGFVKGIEAKLRGQVDESLITPENGQAVTNVLSSRRDAREGPARAQQKEQAEKASAEFLAAAAAKDGATTTASGLVMRITEEGSGVSANIESEVTVHYEGRLPDGKVFDSSIQRGQPATFKVKDLISGWAEGLALMKEGGKATMTIPCELAYGHTGAGQAIPPHTAIEFDVEVTRVKNE